MDFLTIGNRVKMKDKSKTAFIRSLTLRELSTFKIIYENLIRIDKATTLVRLSSLTQLRVQQEAAMPLWD